MKHRPTIATLLHDLPLHRNTALAAKYGYAHSTVRHWRRQLGIPDFPRGNPGWHNKGTHALFKGIAPGRWYRAAYLQALVGCSRQRIYQILDNLTTQGKLVRVGSRGHYTYSMPAKKG